MKTLFRTLAVAAAFGTVAVTSHAKSMVSEHIDSVIGTTRIFNMEATGGDSRVIKLNSKESDDSRQQEVDSLRRVVEMFYFDQFRHSQDPEAPTFLFMSKSANMLMGIGGVVRMRAWEDFGGAIPGNAFVPYLIPIPKNPAEPSKFGTTPAGTALFLQMAGKMKNLPYRLYIEANFNGYGGHDFKLKKAYAMVGDFTVGLANSTFSDPAAEAPTVDAQGSTNKIGTSSVLVRYMPTFKKHWSVGVSMETPSTLIPEEEGITQNVSDRMPDFAACLQYQWADGAHVRVAGIYRTLHWRNLVEERNSMRSGWAVQLSSVAHPTRQITTYLTANYGCGYAGTTNDLLAGSYDLLPVPDKDGSMYAPRSFGYMLGLQYNFRHDLFASASFSQTHLLPKYQLAGDDYRYGWCFVVNCFWNPVPRLQVGAEFDYGRRGNVDQESRYARRIGALCQFSF